MSRLAHRALYKKAPAAADANLLAAVRLEIQRLDAQSRPVEERTQAALDKRLQRPPRARIALQLLELTDVDDALLQLLIDSLPPARLLGSAPIPPKQYAFRSALAARKIWATLGR